MKNRFFLAAAAALLALVVSCSPAATIDREDWEPDVYEALTDLLKDRSLRGGYAVFDCDNTSVIHDISHTLTIYLVENLRFAAAPDHCFTAGLGNPDIFISELGMSAKEFGALLAEDYRALKAMQEGGLSLEEIHRMPQYLDWRAKFLAFYEALGKYYSYGELCLWEPSFAIGYPDEELRELGRQSLSYWLSKGRVWTEEWVSADGRYRGTAEKGLVVPKGMKSLYQALAKAGITPYVCSASAEWLVELLVCDPTIGFGLDPQQVYALRLVEKDGIWEYDNDYPQPFKEGKVACIMKYMAPLHGGAAPVLVAGDSNGDVAMLTEWPEMRVGLIMDQRREGDITVLADGGAPYVAQPVVIGSEAPETN